jgi:ureidoacrylate peracid hydrolase
VAKSGLTYEPDLTGLLIVDPYNDFLSQGASSTNSAVRHSRRTMLSRICGRSSPPLGRMACKSSSPRTIVGAKVIPTAIGRRCRPSRRPPLRDMFSLMERGAGSFHPDFEPLPDEVVAQEHWLSSGFANTDLDLQLKKHGLRSVIVIGMRANTCIESTVRFAAELGYEVTLVKDAIGSFGHAEMDASLRFNMPAYASAVGSTDQIVAKLSLTNRRSTND